MFQSAKKLPCTQLKLSIFNSQLTILITSLMLFLKKLENHPADLMLSGFGCHVE